MAVTSEEKIIPSSDSFTSKWKATDTGGARACYDKGVVSQWNPQIVLHPVACWLGISR